MKDTQPIADKLKVAVSKHKDGMIKALSEEIDFLEGLVNQGLYAQGKLTQTVNKIARLKSQLAEYKNQ